MDECSRKGFWIRVAAAAIDLVCATLFVVGFAIAWSVMAPDATEEQSQRSVTIAYWLAILLVGSFDIFCAATPGKAMLRIAVGHVDCTPAPVPARILRCVTMYGAFILSVIHNLWENAAVAWMAGIWFMGVLVGCLAALNDGRQAWHDQIAGTAIFRRRDIYGPRATGAAPLDTSVQSK